MMESQNRVSVPRIACLAALTASVSLSCRDGGTGPDEPLVDDVEFVAVDAGAYHTCALSATDVAYCWGANYADQLGVERPPDRRAEATPVETEIRFLDIAVGAFWTCGLATGGAAHCWGDNSQGYLGDNSTIWRSRPTRVSGGHAFSTLEAGFYHTCGLTAGGSVYCWGYVISAIRPTPHRVNSDVAFVSFSVGGEHACALTADGVAHCWGNNLAGQVGDGTMTSVPKPEPTPVAGGLRFSTLVTGFAHSCGLTVEGVAWCWGWNGAGQLGDGTARHRSAPVRVASDLRFVTLAAGDDHTCGVTEDAGTHCWGWNIAGQLGDGTTTDRWTPVPVAGAPRFDALDLGSQHSCGITAGNVHCWGWNGDGQLGDGTNLDRHTPSRVILAR